MILRIFNSLTGAAAAIFLFLPIQLVADTDEFAQYKLVELPQMAITACDPFGLIDEFMAYIKANVSQSRVEVNAETMALGILVDLRLSGYQDDSVAGENFWLLIGRDRERYFISRAGVQYIYARGDNELQSMGHIVWAHCFNLNQNPIA